MSLLREHLENSAHFDHLPQKYEEAWRLSDLHRYLDQEYPDADDPLVAPPITPTEDYIQIVNNLLVADRLPPSVKVVHAPERTTITCSEETAFHLYIHYTPKAYIESTLELVIQHNIQVRLFIHIDGASKAFASQKLNIRLDSHAQLFHSQSICLEEKAALIMQTELDQGEQSHYEHFSLLKGGDYLHSFLNTRLHYASSSQISSLMLTQNKEKHLFACEVRHLSDKTSSRILSRQVLEDESTCVFDAKTVIEQGTKGSEVLQASHALLLHPKAQIHSKPHLEIYSDDLSASHGSTVGELDEDALYYLNSRGIPMEKAKEILIMAFINEVLEGISTPSHAEVIHTRLGERYVQK